MVSRTTVILVLLWEGYSKNLLTVLHIFRTVDLHELFINDDLCVTHKTFILKKKREERVWEGGKVLSVHWYFISLWNSLKGRVKIDITWLLFVSVTTSYLSGPYDPRCPPKTFFLSDLNPFLGRQRRFPGLKGSFWIKDNPETGLNCCL